MKRLALISRLRQQIVQLAAQRQTAEQELLLRQELLKGSVVKALRTCGKSGCKCAKGHKHRSYQLSASVDGKTRTYHVAQERLAEVRKWTQNYRRFRQARAQWVKINSQMLRLINELEAAKATEGFPSSEPKRQER